jgi:hypothetical protein
MILFIIILALSTYHYYVFSFTRPFPHVVLTKVGELFRMLTRRLGSFSYSPASKRDAGLITRVTAVEGRTSVPLGESKISVISLTS